MAPGAACLPRRARRKMPRLDLPASRHHRLPFLSQPCTRDNGAVHLRHVMLAMSASQALCGTVETMMDTNGTPSGTLDRIEAFRSYEDGWEDGHRGISDAVADAATDLARIVGPDLVFAVPFDGAIVLTRRWPVERLSHGRSAEIQPDGLMSLFADPLPEDEMEADQDQPLDLDKAAAWLVADTRTGSSGNPTAVDSRAADEEFKLAAGDEVEATTPGAFIRATWFVSQDGTGFLGLDGDSDRCVTLRETDTVRRIAYVGPAFPFQMFSRVREIATGVEYRVVWQKMDGVWVVNEEHSTGEILPAVTLEAVPEPVGQTSQVVHTSETPSRAPVRPECGEHGSDHSACHQDCLGCCGHECDEDCLTIMGNRDA